MRGWTIQESAELYGIRNWGRDFLRISEAGNVVIAPDGENGPWVDLKSLVDDLVRRGIGLPVLIRFTDILRVRVHTLANAFVKVIEEYGYGGHYRGVYPIKVNQQRPVVEDIVRFGAPFHFGLEAGSKPELLVVLALLVDPEAYIICNGYKDEEYIETALMAQKIGRRPILVIEKASEMPLAIEVGKRVGVDPIFGVRARLASRGAGRWEESTGDRAKFGLTVEEIVDLCDGLRAAGKLDSLQLLHFHIGSQVSAIRSFKEALREATRIFVELHRLGAPLRMFDVGGGLGVDYDGSHTNFASSVNYTVEEYATDVVAAIQSACDEAEVPHPDIVTEAGRAMVAHSSVLVFNVVGVATRAAPEQAIELEPDDPQVLTDLRELVNAVSRKNFQETWHDALAAREEILSMFNLGLLDLRQRARGERLFRQAVTRIEKILRDVAYVPDEMEGLTKALADTYYCNFSVFQSAPDAWAVDQLFPVIPIHRLGQKPSRRGVLADLTCDSDGKLDRFIDLHDVKDVLELHEPNGEDYLLGVFLVGAYQEILGDLHNLFGDTNAVHVTLENGGGYRIDNVVEGNSVDEVLSFVEYTRQDLVARVRVAIEGAVREGRMTLEESGRMLTAYQRGLEGYTYLE